MSNRLEDLLGLIEIVSFSSFLTPFPLSFGKSFGFFSFLMPNFGGRKPQ